MRALVVYESMFGNTKSIAEAIGRGVAESVDVDVVEVGQAGTSIRKEFDLVIVGGPTHAFSMTRASTRADAAKQAAGPLVSAGIGIREWLDALPHVTRSLRAATFDTKVQRPNLPGSAAKRAEKRLSKLGFEIIAPHQTYWVTDVQGPLSPDETRRAHVWGASLGSRVAAMETRVPQLS